MSFWKGFVKKAIKIEHGISPDQLKTMENLFRDLQKDIRGMKNINVNLNENDIKKIFSNIDRVRDPKRLLYSGLALGGGITAGALIGKALTKRVGREVPMFSSEFQNQQGQPVYTQPEMHPIGASKGR